MEKIVEKTIQQFCEFTQKYDLTSWNLNRKINHSYSVAEKCFFTACRFNLSERERNMAFVIGLLHDTGRFVQWEKYHTFSDKDSVDHADISYDLIMNGTFKLDDFTNEEIEIIANAVRNHTKENHTTNEKLNLFSTILKACDGYSNVILAASGAHMLFVNSDGYRKEVVDDFINLKPLFVYHINTKLERILAITALTYYSRYDFFKDEIKQNNIIDIICEEYIKYLIPSEQKVLKDTIEKFKVNFYNPNFKTEFNIITKKETTI